MGWRDWLGVGERRWKKAPDEEVQPAKTLWDWLQLLIVPAILIGVTFAWSASQTRSDNKREDRRSQDATLQAYLDQMSGLMLDRKLLTSKESDAVRAVARTVTLTTLRRLDGSRKGEVVRFLAEARLIPADTVGRARVGLLEADLAGADLKDASLGGINLAGAHLEGADLSGAWLPVADLTNAKLARANLTGADLSNAELNLKADLRGATLRDAGLAYADLTYADLIGADLTGVDLEGANLTGANLTGANLTGALLLNAVFTDADLTDANLTDVKRADLIGAKGLPEVRP